MRGILILLALHQAWATSLVAQTTSTYQPAEARAELARFRDALLRAHPALSDSAPRAAFGRFADHLADEVRAPLSSVDFHLLAMRLTAGLYDGHTSAALTGPTSRYVQAQGILPLHVRIQDEAGARW